MKIRTKYILFVVIIHLLTLVLSYFVSGGNKLLFIVSEILVLISLLLAWRLYRQLIQPLQFLVQGADAIQDRDFNVKFRLTGKYEMDKLIRVYNEMIDALRAERVQQEQQHFFLEKLIHTSPTGLLIMDYDQQIRQINPRAREILQAMGVAGINDISDPVFYQIMQLPSGTSRTVTVDGVNTYKFHKSHFIDRGFARQFIMIEELTAEILAAEKNAYGKVIRMMAHEVNNTIGPVNSILQSALRCGAMQQEGNGELQHALEVAMDRNHNLNLFTRNFADLVRLPAPACKELDLRQLLEQVSRLMMVKAGEKKIRFDYENAGAPFFIHADGQQLEQVLINIVKNAVEAIGERGTIQFTLNAGARRLIIADSGVGVPDDVADQLFSPFFSTKKDGQGIGLTLVKEVLLNHGYEFSLKTVAPGRTEFCIQF